MKDGYLFAGIFSVMMWATPAVAQQSSSPSSGSSLNIPEWAQPTQSPSGYAPGSSTGDAPASSMPGMPPAPKQTPIDGGLSLLAAAGASYALYRLRRRKGEDDEDLP